MPFEFCAHTAAALNATPASPAVAEVNMRADAVDGEPRRVRVCAACMERVWLFLDGIVRDEQSIDQRFAAIEQALRARDDVRIGSAAGDALYRATLTAGKAEKRALQLTTRVQDCEQALQRLLDADAAQQRSIEDLQREQRHAFARTTAIERTVISLGEKVGVTVQYGLEGEKKHE